MLRLNLWMQRQVKATKQCYVYRRSLWRNSTPATYTNNKFQKEVCLTEQDKFIPYEKLSKKKKRERDNEKRKSWGLLNPVTRKSKNPRAYNRAETKRYDEGEDE